MRWRRDALAAVAALAALIPGAARAEPASADEDTTYGRIDGDLAASLGAGVAVAPRGPRGELDLRVRYLSTVGAFFTYEDGAIFGGGAEPVRVIAFGTELRPLFIGRWLTGRELAAGRLDLLIDSFGLELGTAFTQPAGGSFGGRPALQAGLGLEIPILEAATGPWIGLHGGVRWSDHTMGGDPVTTVDDRAAFLGVTLAWHQVFVAHAVDVSDRAPR